MKYTYLRRQMFCLVNVCQAEINQANYDVLTVEVEKLS